MGRIHLLIWWFASGLYFCVFVFFGVWVIRGYRLVGCWRCFGCRCNRTVGTSPSREDRGTVEVWCRGTFEGCGAFIGERGLHEKRIKATCI